MQESKFVRFFTQAWENSERNEKSIVNLTINLDLKYLLRGSIQYRCLISRGIELSLDEVACGKGTAIAIAYQYALEVLIPLSPSWIQHPKLPPIKLRVFGVQKWFEQALQRYISGISAPHSSNQSGLHPTTNSHSAKDVITPLRLIEYGYTETRTVAFVIKNGEKEKQVKEKTVSDRKWWEPRWDWEDFAMREGINLEDARLHRSPGFYEEQAMLFEMHRAIRH
jgi:hypothetical protein